MSIELVYPTMLHAIGNADRVEVLRSPVVRMTTEPIFQKGREYINRRRVVIGEVEVSVYVPPAVRNAVYATAA